MLESIIYAPGVHLLVYFHSAKCNSYDPWQKERKTASYSREMKD